MSNLHPKATTGEFLPDVRHMTLLDANMELNGLINHAVSEIFPNEDMCEERDFMLRGLLIRIQALTNVMYAASCCTDADLVHHLSAAYGKHHSFVSTPATETDTEATHG